VIVEYHLEVLARRARARGNGWAHGTFYGLKSRWLAVRWPAMR
jgi:hypothetical protein